MDASACESSAERFPSLAKEEEEIIGEDLISIVVDSLLTSVECDVAGDFEVLCDKSKDGEVAIEVRPDKDTEGNPMTLTSPTS